MAAPLIAILNDGGLLADVLSELLRDVSYRTRVFCESQTAVRHLRTVPPDLILIDLWPGEDAPVWAALEQLRRAPATAHVPIIILSQPTPAVIKRTGLLRQLRIRVVAKPVSRGDVLGLIAQALGDQRRAG